MVGHHFTTRTPLPPLPASLSTRLVDTRTGACKYHPNVQLCSLVKNNTEWVLRRKICPKCGALPNRGFKPGVSVRLVPNPTHRTKRRVSELLTRNHHPSPANLSRSRRHSSAGARCDKRTPNLMTKSSLEALTASTARMSLSSEGDNVIASNEINKAETWDAERHGKNKSGGDVQRSSKPLRESSKTVIRQDSQRGHKKEKQIRKNNAHRDVLLSPEMRSSSISRKTLVSSQFPSCPKIMSKSRSNKRQSSLVDEIGDDSVIKNVGCIYFSPQAFGEVGA